MESVQTEPSYGLRRGAEEFPLMVVLSIIYPCNFGCPNCPYTDCELRDPAVLPPAQRRSVSRAAVEPAGGGVRRVRRLDAVHRRRRADAPSAHGGHDRVREGEGRARLAEHQRQHVRANRGAADQAAARHRRRHRSDRVLDGRRRRRDLRRRAPAAPRRPAARPAEVVGQRGRQRPRRAGAAQGAQGADPHRRVDHPAGADRREARRRDRLLGRTRSASTKSSRGSS